MPVPDAENTPLLYVRSNWTPSATGTGSPVNSSLAASNGLAIRVLFTMYSKYPLS